MGQVSRACASVVVVSAMLPLLPSTARAGVIFQTSSAPGAATGSGVVIDNNQSLGARFQLSDTTRISHIGVRMSRITTGSIFGSIVRLSSMNDYPDSAHPFNTPDVLATTLLPIPSVTADVTGEIGPIMLPAGTYALVFGGGEFGAGGVATASQNNTPILPQSYFYWNESNGAYLDGSYGNVRFYALDQVPEPSSALAGIAVAVAAMVRRARPRRRDLALTA